VLRGAWASRKPLLGTARSALLRRMCRRWPTAGENRRQASRARAADAANRGRIHPARRATNLMDPIGLGLENF